MKHRIDSVITHIQKMPDTTKSALITIGIIALSLLALSVPKLYKEICWGSNIATDSTRIVAYANAVGTKDGSFRGEGYLLIDAETGVEYLSIQTQDDVTVTPLYNTDGSLKTVDE